MVRRERVMPKGVNQAITGIWVTLGVSVLAALINRWVGDISTAGFVGCVVFYSIFCIFPYKLAKGSNPARWIYTILMAMSVLFMIGGAATYMPKADLVASIIMTPIEIFIIFRLFQPQASQWFSKP